MFSCGKISYQKSYVCWFYTRIRDEGENIVYCTKCGTNHAEDATVCVQCGAPLYGANGGSRPHWKHGISEGEYGFHKKSGYLTGIIIGLIIIFAGFSLLMAEIFGIDVPWGPIIMIFAGVFVLIRLFQVRNRRR